MVQIFLSYARNDEKKVMYIYEMLSEAGFSPWMDQRNILPGENWELSIKRAIKESDFFLAILSKNSTNKRGIIQSEIKYALECWKLKLDSDIYLIPARIEYCDAPESLSAFQWVDLFNPNGWASLTKALCVGAERQGKVVELEKKIFDIEMLVNDRPEQSWTESSKSIENIKNNSDNFSVLVWAEKTEKKKDQSPDDYHIGDTLSFFCKATHDCYLTLINIGTSGKFTLLLPNAHIKQRALKANEKLQFPETSDQFMYRLSGPVGIETIKAIATIRPIQLLDISINPADGLMFYTSEKTHTTRDIEIVSKKLGTLSSKDWAEYTLRLNVIN